jgi:hypothetical protein
MRATYSIFHYASKSIAPQSKFGFVAALDWLALLIVSAPVVVLAISQCLLPVS